MIVGLMGFARVGKDTAALAFTTPQEQGKPEEGIRVALADRLKMVAVEALSHLFPRKEIEDMLRSPEGKAKLRPFLVSIGATARAIQPDVWIQQADREVQAIQHDILNRFPIITDIRYANEAKWLLGQPNPLLIYLDRPGYGPANDEEQRSFDEIFACDEIWKSKDMIILRNDGDIEKLHMRVRQVVAEKQAIGW